MKDTNSRDYRRRTSRVRRIVGQKMILPSDINIMERELRYLAKNYEMNYKLNILFGKCKLLEGKSKEAIKYFNDAIDCSGETIPKAAYYGLFKASVNLNNYEDAIKYLSCYDNCFDTDFNMSFYFKILNKILSITNTNYEIHIPTNNSIGYINCVKCPESGYRIYQDAENYFDNENYRGALKKLISFQKICEKENYPVDVSHLIKACKYMNILIHNKEEQERNALLSSITDVVEKKEILINSILKDNTNIEALIELVNMLIADNQLDTAYAWLNHPMDNNEKEKYITELNQARRIVYERVEYKNNIDSISKYMEMIEEHLANNNIYGAVKVCFIAYEKLKLPFFLFKIGEIKYFARDFEGAKKYFLKYLCDGDIFKNESYIYLYFITKVKNPEKAKKYYNRFKKNRFNKNAKKGDYLECYNKAEEEYLNYLEVKNSLALSNVDNTFNNYFREIITSIKQGKFFRIESINKNKLMPDEFALIEIHAAPYLLEQGMIGLADKYYENAKQYVSDDQISELVKKYELKRKKVSTN